MYTSTVYCSYPDQVCVYTLSSTTPLPSVSIGLENQLVDPLFQTQACGKGFVRLKGVTQLSPPLGMIYDAMARVTTPGNTSYCSNTTAGTLVIPSNGRTRMFTIVVGARTDYDQTKGNSASNYSFRGTDPAVHVKAVTNAAAAKSSDELRAAHTIDYQTLARLFSLNLPDPAHSAGFETSTIIDRYNWTGPGDPYLESVLFDYGRHLFISSSRQNSLPPNLAGKWSIDLEGAWSCDYHANINLQMNHWGVDQTGLGDLQRALWRYMQDTWVPRGTETAQLLYDAPGWVVHDEMNIFGHTGMKYSAVWANYPVAAAWMMQHVYDHFSYSQNTTWLAETGYPLLKGVTEFWLSQLQQDAFFEDGTLVVNPCNSPEHGPTTFACTHYQQLIHQLLTSILLLPNSITAPDHDFLNAIHTALASLDTGLHIGSFGEIKEWKIPDSFGYDIPNDTHRHLSHLVGWYPGFSLSGLLNGTRNSTITSAIATSLLNRGLGDGADADAGWEKVWRSACWARLNDSNKAYEELRFAVGENFAGNGLSMYSAHDPPFQIDANFGIVGAVLALLVTDLPGHEVVLGPALPKTWGPGRVEGLRLRGGGEVGFGWDEMGKVREVKVVRGREGLVLVNIAGEVLYRG